MVNEKPLVIVGMHRSGTSFAASWLHAMGMNLGDRLMGAGVGNVKGHFEDMDFHDTHEWVFKNHRIKYGALRFPVDFKLTSDERAKLDDLVNKKQLNDRQWGWKEPRTCLFLDYYKKAFPEAKYFILYRPCNEVVDSLLRRDINMFDRKYPKKSKLHWLKYKLRKKTYHKNIRKFNTDNYVQIWAYYNKKIMELIENIDPSDFILSDQSSLLRSDKQIFNKLVELGYELNYKPISGLFDKDLFKNMNVEDYTNSNYPNVDSLKRFFEDKIKNHIA